MEQNYRSTQTILEAANTVIENNSDRKPKELWTENPKGDLITHYLAMDERDEARYISDNIIKQKTIYGVPYQEMAVLYRTNAQSRAVEESFMSAGIAYTIVGGQKFYERKEIKDILAYLKVIFNPSDAVSLQRIINVPRRGIGDTSIGRLNEYASTNDVSLFDAVTNPSAVTTLTPKARHQLEGLAELLFKLIVKMEKLPVANLIEAIMRDSGYLAELESEQTPQDEARVENLKELLSVAKQFATTETEDTLENFLSHVALVSDVDSADTSGDKVTLMTFHSAKGLEYPLVFMAGLDEGIFPHARTLMNETEIEEERRLCYVGITRAQRRLFVTNSRMRTIYGNTTMYAPSRFLKEIPPELLEKQVVRTERPKQGAIPIRPEVKQRITPATHATPAATAPRVKTAEWKAGDRVQHEKWGNGTVVEVRGSGDNQEVKVA